MYDIDNINNTGKFIVKGGRALSGSISAHGAKNSVLALLAATMLTNGITVLHRCPDIKDVHASFKIMEFLGCKIEYDGETAVIDTSMADKWDIPFDLMKEMRSSFVFLGSLLAKFNRADVSYPGGCELGPRPIGMHLKAFEKMGVTIKDEYGIVKAACEGALTEGTVVLEFPSVGATENIMLLATAVQGTTVIENAAMEPEIEDLQNYITAMGGNVRGAGTSRVVIVGKSKLNAAEYTVMPDRIEAATFMAAAGITGGDIEINGIVTEHLTPVTEAMRGANMIITEKGNSLRIKSNGRISPIRIRTMPHPGFPTDAQSQLLATVSVANGTSQIIENIFQSRFGYTSELIRMGAKITVEGRMAVVEGVERLSGAMVRATDLRGGAALLVAALKAEGETVISDAGLIDRGYDSIEKSFAALGGNVIKL